MKTGWRGLSGVVDAAFRDDCMLYDPFLYDFLYDLLLENPMPDDALYAVDDAITALRLP